MLTRKIFTTIVAIGCFTMVCAAQSNTPVNHPRGINAVTQDHIFGNPNLNSAPAATQYPLPFAAGTYAVGLQEHPATTPYEAEEDIVADPANPNFVLSAISDFSTLSYYGITSGTTTQIYSSYINLTKYAWSSDGGKTWTQVFMPYQQSQVVLPQFQNDRPETGDGYYWDEMSDPVVAIDSTNHIAYLADLYFDDYDNKNGFYLSSSSIENGSVNFTAAATHPIAVSRDPNSQTFEDKPWMTVDNSRNHATQGNVYAAWVHYLAQQYFPAGGQIQVVRSSDHGVTFSTPVIVSPPSQVNNVQAPQITVDPMGRVIVSWLYCLDYEPVPGQFNDKCTQSQIWGAVSTDAGKTFSAPTQLTPTHNDLDGSGFPSYYRKWSEPSMAVSPRTGQIAIVYADQIGANSAIEYVHCPPAFSGSCSSPVPVNDVSDGQRVYPAITIDNQGIVHVSWYDSRNDPDNPYSSNLDVYATYANSVDQPFHPNVRVTTSSINFGESGFIGDYSGITAVSGVARPAWTDGTLTTTTLTVPNRN